MILVMGCLFSKTMEMYSDHSRPSTEHSEKGCMAVIRRENTRSTTSTTVTRACQVQNVLPHALRTDCALCSKKLQLGVSVGPYCSLRHVLQITHFAEPVCKWWRFFDSRNTASRRHSVHALYYFIGYKLVHSFSMRW